MNNPWKLATIGIALTVVTAMASGLTTAWMLRPTATAQADEVRMATAPRPGARYAVPALRLLWPPTSGPGPIRSRR